MILPDSKTPKPSSSTSPTERDALLASRSSPTAEEAQRPSSSATTSDAPPPAYTPPTEEEHEHRYTRLAIPRSWPVRQVGHCFIVFVVVVAVFVLFWAAERVAPSRGGRRPDEPATTSSRTRTSTSVMPSAKPSGVPDKGDPRSDEERYGKR